MKLTTNTPDVKRTKNSVYHVQDSLDAMDDKV